MNVIENNHLEASAVEMANEPNEKCVSNLIRKVFSQHNITESDYDLIYNLTGREVSQLLHDVGYLEKESVSCYCSQLRNFSIAYRQIHGYLSFFVCIVGVISNILNIIVLTRREMSVLPINRILRGLALTDIVLMIEYIPFIFFYYFRLFPNLVHSYPGTIFIWLHVNFLQIIHTISVFMTLALACWRYSAIKYPQRNVGLSSEEKCSRCIIMAYVMPFLFCLPAYLIFSVNEITVVENEVNEKIYVLDFSTLALSNDELFFYAYFWIYFVIIKLIPCIILTVITFWLIRTLKRASKRRDVLKLQDYKKENASLCATMQFTKSRKHRRIDRTTNILIAVLTLFIITELPQGILGLLSIMFGQRFFKTCYASLGDLMDILALFNGAVDFILYCTMSKQFRKTFGQLFKPKILNNLLQTQEIEMLTTNV